MPGRHQPQPGINSKPPTPSSPSGKPPSSSSPPSQRPTTRASGEQRRKPGPHHSKIKATQVSTTSGDPGQVLQQRNDISDIGPNGMRRQATFQRQMPLKVVNRPPERSRQPHSRAKQAGPHRLRIRHKRTHCAAALTWSSIATQRQQPHISKARARYSPNAPSTSRTNTMGEQRRLSGRQNIGSWSPDHRFIVAIPPSANSNRTRATGRELRSAPPAGHHVGVPTVDPSAQPSTSQTTAHVC